MLLRIEPCYGLARRPARTAWQGLGGEAVVTSRASGHPRQRSIRRDGSLVHFSAEDWLTVVRHLLVPAVSVGLIDWLV